jgi:hypothetical protein
MRIPNPPLASSLMTTARSFGSYDLAAALADLIDNSIRAEARKINISFEPEANDVIVRIRDDGKGMVKEELISAMRPASANPEDPRDASDLGRFGWGLKSASLSQARVLTVVSWTTVGCTSASWDIDDLENWSMELESDETARKYLRSPQHSRSGTEVIWSNSDRLIDTLHTSNIDEQLNDKIRHAQRQLSLIFHRYLSGEARRKLSIDVQGVALAPLDPFMSQHPATQTIDEEVIKLRGREEITVKPYTIPHFSKLTVEEKELLGGDEGLVRNQGFYVYRNKRLIIYGTWFRLVPHGELSQLTRVRIDLPNTVDQDWKITLDKSDAQLPVVLRVRLRELIKRFAKRSTSANRRRGASLSIEKQQPVWKRIAHHGRIRYQINRDHPIVWELIAESEDSSIAREALSLIESFIPTESLIKDRESQHLEQVQAITDPEVFNSLLDACYLACVRQKGGHPRLKEVLEFAKSMEPFSSQWKYSESYIKNDLKEQWGLK